MNLWYTETDDIWANSYSTNSKETSHVGHLIAYKDKLYCFYIVDNALNGSNIFYMTKDKNGSWSESKPVGKLGDNNTTLSIDLYGDKILIASGTSNDIKLITYEKDSFSNIITHNIRFSYNFSLSIFNNKINLFLRGADEDGIWHFELEEENNKYKNLGKVKYWEGWSSFSKEIHASVSPKTIVYQGLLYLIYAAPDKDGWYYVKLDKGSWSYPTRFTRINYSHSPGLAIHNGLLKVAFVGSIDKRTDRLSDRTIYQYCFDGNSWSLPAVSTHLLAGNGVNMASYMGDLFAVYPGIGQGGITDNTIDPHYEY